jgi:hypothetical protein
VLSNGHFLVLDHNGNLLREYRDNVGHCRFFQQWYLEMETAQQIHHHDGGLSQRVRGTLDSLGFHEPVDQILVGLALKCDKYIVSEDSDFGAGSSQRDEEHREVFEYLTGELDLSIHDAEGCCVRLQERMDVVIQESPVVDLQYCDGEEVWNDMVVGNVLNLVREPENPHDSCAVAIYWRDFKVGYLPSQENRAIQQMMDRGVQLRAHIVDLRDDPDPKQRFVVAVSAEL